jgi:hypothetical protein
MTQGHAERERPARPEGALEPPSVPLDRTTPVTREGFSGHFDRCFDRVHAYVSRRVKDRESCERIVGEVLAENLDLLVDRGEERRELSRLKASSDRLIGLNSERSLAAGAIAP